MPRFPVAFGRRRSTVDNPENAPLAEPSFRVLERNQVAAAPGKSFDGGARLAAKTQHLANPSISSQLTAEDNIFADLKTNRYVNLLILSAFQMDRLRRGMFVTKPLSLVRWNLAPKQPC